MKASDRDAMYRMTMEQLVEEAQSAPGISQTEWFKFTWVRWLGSARRQNIPLAAQGAYVNLLCRSWMNFDCGLPTDQEELRIMAGAGVEEWQNIGHYVVNMFTRIGDRLYSHRLLLCRYDAITQSRTNSANRKKQLSKCRKNQKHTTVVNDRTTVADDSRRRQSESESESLSESKLFGEHEGGQVDAQKDTAAEQPEQPKADRGAAPVGGPKPLPRRTAPVDLVAASMCPHLKRVIAAYPRPNAHRAAWREWATLLSEGRDPAALADQCISAIENQRATTWADWKPNFIPELAKWLRDGRFEDSPVEVVQELKPPYWEPFQPGVQS